MSMDITIPEGSPARRAIEEAVQGKKVLIFAGIPGVGKSLLLQQSVLAAHLRGRNVHLIQWDVVRAAFEPPEIRDRYPEADGITHPGVRLAASRWIRQGIADWVEGHPEPRDVLFVEAPVEGYRLVEVAIKMADAVEPLLAGDMTMFLVPIPSRTVRRAIEERRAQELDTPLHERERGNASMAKMFGSMRELHRAGRHFGIAGGEPPSDYDPELYEAVFRHLLRDRPLRVIAVDSVWNVERSVYDLDVDPMELTPEPADVERIYTELASATEDELDERVSNWFDW